MKIIPSDYYKDEWSSNGSDKNLLAIVASNQINYSIGNIVVFVDLTKLYDKVNENTMMPGTSLTVLDKDKNVIINTGSANDLENMESIFYSSSNKSIIQKGDYNYHIVRSDYNSFTYINKVPYGYESYLSTIKYNKIILFITTIIGVIISIILSIYIYSPVKKILWLVGVQDGNMNQNKYKYIYNSIEKMQLENQLINSKMDNVKEEVMRSIFFKMIDDITFYKDMKDQIDTYFKAIFFNRQFLMVGFDLLTNQQDNMVDEDFDIMPDRIKKEIEIALVKIGSGNCSVVVFYMENLQLVALVGVNDQIKRSKLLSDIEGVKDQLQKTVFANYTVLVAVSKFYTEPQSCKEAFEEIKLCFAYRTINNTKTIIDLEKSEYSYDIYMPLNFDEKLTNYILSANASEGIKYIKQVIDTNVSNNVSNIKFKYIIDNIFNNLVNILVYLNVDREEILTTEREFRSRVKKYLNNPEKINNYFEDLVKNTTKKVHSESQSKLDKDLLLQYINTHYAENLYLDKIAEEFNTTPKYFSNYFKKAFGINFVEYLNKIRISHAKELLKNSELTMNEIGERVGYLNPSTFTSTFKKYSGITPSEFRKSGKNW
jgi:AraC-like DNA-binding protein